MRFDRFAFEVHRVSHNQSRIRSKTERNLPEPSTWRRVGMVAIATLAIQLTGCVDGPLFALKKINPYYTKQWREDAEKGVVFRQRQAEIRLVREQIEAMTSEEQARWSKLLADVYDKDSSPELRREAVMTLAKSPHLDAEAALVRACTDKNDKVRLAACKAMGGRQSESAAKMLATVAQTDKEMSVRLAAIHSLGSFQNDETKALLRKCLDEKSPALQYEATVALKSMTGRDFNGDVEAWRKFMDGQSVEEPTRNMAQQIGDTFSIRR